MFNYNFFSVFFIIICSKFVYSLKGINVNRQVFGIFRMKICFFYGSSYVLWSRFVASDIHFHRHSNWSAYDIRNVTWSGRPTGSTLLQVYTKETKNSNKKKHTQKSNNKTVICWKKTAQAKQLRWRSFSFAVFILYTQTLKMYERLICARKPKRVTDRERVYCELHCKSTFKNKQHTISVWFSLSVNWVAISSLVWLIVSARILVSSLLQIVCLFEFYICLLLLMITRYSLFCVWNKLKRNLNLNSNNQPTTFLNENKSKTALQLHLIYKLCYKFSEW